MNCKDIERVTSFNFLGLMITTTFSWDCHIYSRCKQKTFQNFPIVFFNIQIVTYVYNQSVGKQSPIKSHIILCSPLDITYQIVKCEHKCFVASWFSI